MSNEIGSKTIISSLIFKFAENIGSKLVGFIIGVLLARLLNPEVFGVLAILMAIVTILQTFVDSGLSVALIQNKSTENLDYSTVFYISLTIAIIIYAILFITSPYILSFFNMNGYEKQLRVLLLVLLFYSFNSIQIAQLTKGMKFKQILVCQLISTIISGLMAILAAYCGLGIWALIIHYVSNSIIACITYSFVVRWHPKLYFSIERAKLFFGFGIKMLASSLLTQLFYQIRTFAVGKIYSSTDLAYYSRGDQIPNIVAYTIDSVFRSVMLPVYALKQDQNDSLLKSLRKTIRLNSFIIFPAMFGLSAIAPSMVIILYTSKWSGCIPFLQALSLANLSIPIISPCLVSIQAIGRSDSYFRLEVARRVVMLVILAGSFLFKSLLAIAIGWVISSYIDALLVVGVTRKLIGYDYAMMISDIVPNFLISAFMYIAVSLLGNILLPVAIVFIIQLIAGIVIYIVLASLFGNTNLRECKRLVKSYL